MSRITRDVGVLQEFLSNGMLLLFGNVFMAVVVLGMMLQIHVGLTLMVLLVVPPIALTIRLFATRVVPAWRGIQQQAASLTGLLQENVTGVRVVRAFARESFEEQRFGGENERYLQSWMKAARLWVTYSPLTDFFGGVATLAVLWYGGRLALVHQLSLGGLVAFTWLLQVKAVAILWQFSSLVNLASRTLAAADRVFELLDTEPDIVERPDAYDLPAASGEVEFRNVSFRYPGTATPVLTDVSFRVGPGEMVALVGLTGSGKSTIAQLVPRFYDVTTGQVLVGGHDVRHLTFRSLRQHVSLVLQEPLLFSASIRDNIAFGKPGASQAEVEVAASVAQLHEFVMTLARGYDEPVGERGVGLSGGEKQRLSIARALLVQPQLLILDDATSSVDAETELRLHQALREWMRDRTILLITHRMSVLKQVDRILVVGEGRLVEEGTHSQLIANKGLYHELYSLHLAHDVTEMPDAVWRRVLERGPR